MKEPSILSKQHTPRMKGRHTGMLRRLLRGCEFLLCCLALSSCIRDISDEVAGIYTPGERCRRDVPYRFTWVALNDDETAVVVNSEGSFRGTWEAYDDGDRAICTVIVDRTRDYEFSVGHDTLSKRAVLTPSSPMVYDQYDRCSMLYRQYQRTR